MVEIDDLDPQKKFEIKLHVSLINYAERILPEYREKQDLLQQYILEQVSDLKKLLNIDSENFSIIENKKIIFKK